MSEGRVPEIEPPGAEGTTPKDSSGMREPLPGGSGTTTSSSSSSSSSSGCGCVPMGPAVAGIPDPSITVSITPTTGGQFDITVDRNESVENLKKIISKRLKVAKERICLLHRERQLRDGTLQENQLQDGSRLTLLPSVETGLLAQRPEQSVMQALESLSDSQVNDFLSGKAPLNLTMRLGDHMMLIQLQLSTVTPATSSTATSTTTLANSSSQIQPTPAPRSQQQQPQQQPQPQQHSAQAQAHAPAAAAAVHHQLATQQALAAQLNQELLNARMAAAPSMDASRRSSGYSSLPSTPTTPNCPPKLSLSSSVVNNLASSSSLFATPSPSPPNTPTSPISPCCTVSPCLPPVPLQSQQQQQPNQQTLSNSSSSSSSSSSRHPPPPPLNLHQQQKKHVSASSRHRMLTCLGRLPYHHHHHHHHHHHYHHHHRNLHRFARKMGLANKSSSCPSCPETEAMVDTSEPSLSSSSAVASAAAVASANKCPDYSSNSSQCSECAKSPKKKMCCCPPECSGVPASTTTTSSQQQAIASPSADGCAAAAAAMTTTTTTTVSAPPTPTTPTTPTSPEGLDTTTTNETTTANPTATLDTRALVEASRNLTQKLKQLSYEENAKRRQGAIIESMHHHGKGVYTGTFSGTLNPALQDRHGRPKRDISTIIHILNDLLCATPASSAGHLKVHYRNPNRASASSSASTTGAISGPQSSSMFSISSGGPSSSSNMQTDHAASSPSSPNLACPSEELSKENEATKGKMRKLRLVMEQRREKMRARRQARAAPYTTNFAAVTPDPEPDASSTSSSTNGSGSKSAGDSPNEPELSPCSSEPVVA